MLSIYLFLGGRGGDSDNILMWFVKDQDYCFSIYVTLNNVPLSTLILKLTAMFGMVNYCKQASINIKVLTKQTFMERRRGKYEINVNNIPF